ncbi:PH domain-containing protein [Micromonospora sp. CPCC 205561]|uniref:PH domain-containing protein n=1 Tax=Micromonospora sp. CPCC 205561 TaxID=3122407 RepID=UPI002FF0BDFD
MSGVPWRRLDSRVVWVDAARSLLSLAPVGLAVTVFGVEPGSATLWPVLTVAVVGVTGAARDLLRWSKTRYRVTEERVEMRTGLLFRTHRSVRRERIRSVEATALLRHRLAGLRVVTVGAGLSGGGQAVVRLDAVTVETAGRLRRELLRGVPDEASATVGAVAADAGPTRHDGGQVAAGDSASVLARIRWSWVVHNVVNWWAFVMAAGLLWGAYWTAQSFGLDAAGTVAGLVDWRSLGAGRTVVLGVAAAGALGVLGMAVAFVAEYWDFRLLRVRTPAGTVLRTTHGLFKTREVDRDDDRLRGVEIAEPVLWRWMGTADTNVITTGLKVWSMTPATTILPRGPVRVARAVAAAVLEADPSPFAAPLRRHPRAALRRRVGWAVLTVVSATGVLAVSGDALGSSRLWLGGVALAPPALLAAGVAYRSLGHAVSGGHLVVRSGLVSRATAALRGGAVVGWRVRQSVWQRRLGLATLAAATAAGHGRYAAIDVAADDVTGLAERVLPGLLAPFVVDSPRPGPSAVGVAATAPGRETGGGLSSPSAGFDPQSRVPGRERVEKGATPGAAR